MHIFLILNAYYTKGTVLLVYTFPDKWPCENRAVVRKREEGRKYANFEAFC